MTQIAPLKILKASAGSGKTFSLTLHYLTLLLHNENSYKEILAVTFTNKATAEMKHRILSVLHGLAIEEATISSAESEVDDFRQILLKQNSQWSANEVQQKAHRVYRRIIHDYSHFTISTIDGFSQKVIRSFTYELNLDAGYKIEMNTNKVKADLTTMLNQLLDDRPDLLNWIIDYAEKKISNNENWNYRNELSKLAGLIFSENFQELNAALSAADSNEVFNLLNLEIVEKTEAYLETLDTAITIFSDTFKTLNVLPEDLKGKTRNKLIAAAKLTPNIRKLSTTKLLELIDKYTDLLDDEKAFLDSEGNTRHDLVQGFNPILKQFVEIKNYTASFIAYQAVQNNLYYLRLLKEMSDLLGTWRKENGAQLISDSQILLNKLGLDNNNDPTFIWEKIGNKYNYFLFDEFQDTSRIQWKNYSPLLLNALANSEFKQNEHLIVGDVKQSIYRWRNGDWRILLQQVEEQVRHTFHLDESTTSKLIENCNLETNFRSLPNIIAFNNYLYEKIPVHLQQVLNDKINNSLSTEGLQWWKQQHNDIMLIRAYENSTQKIPHKYLTNAEDQGNIEIEYLHVEHGRARTSQVMEDSAIQLCQKIGEWISSGRYQARQIGILVRSNRQATLIIQQLMEYKEREKLSFDVISGDALSLGSNEAIQLLIETLKAIIYTSEKHVIHHARIAYLYQSIHCNKTFDPEAWLLFKENSIQTFDTILPEALLTEWAEWQKLPLVHLVEKLFEVYGLTSMDNIHLPYILHFKDIVGNFTANGERGINQFLEFWDEDGNKAFLPSGNNVNAIEVTTIHKSKGLAYDVVMIPFCSWAIDGLTNGDFWIDTHSSPFAALGKIPIKYNSSVANSIFYKQYYEEMLFNYMDALNTLYVATTRAKQHLYITAPAFAEKEDKKTGIYKDVKNEYISDVLYQVLDQTYSPFKLEEGKFNNDKIIVVNKEKDKKNIRKTVLPISLHQYPTSKAMEAALEKISSRDINVILMLEKAAQYGVLAHEVMSEAVTEADIQSIVNRYIEEGILAANEKDILLKEINNIWHHPQVNQWLTGNYRIWNEASIITADGKTIRPDKVFTSETETIILDFKFTTDDYIDHKYQVTRYIQALENLDYKNVKGFLFYAKSNHLQEV